MGIDQRAEPRNWLSRADSQSRPSQGYTYTRKSTKERTEGTSMWPVTATVDWTVNWTSNVGPSGTLALQTNGASALTVGEWRSVLVAGSGN